MLRVISLRATATGKGTQKNYRATNNENDCDPNERTGIGQNRESAAVTLRTPANARQTKQPESNEGDADDPDPVSEGHYMQADYYI
jgi:hypothetical protein